jgi:hypothetical protein
MGARPITMTEDKLKEAIIAFLDNEFLAHEKKDGYYSHEMYADYNDKLSGGDIAGILGSKAPRKAFVDLICGFWDDAEWQYVSDLREKAIKHLEEAFPDEEIDDSEVIDWLDELAYFEIPFGHYLKQSVDINIMLDTGDMNYDFTLSNIYPAYCGEKGAALDDKSGLVWLIKQQGHSKQGIRGVLYGKEKTQNAFLASVYDELVNVASHINVMTFLVSMTLDEAIQVAELANAQDRNGRIYSPVSSRPDCGCIVLGEDTMCGLFNPWSGGGSLLEIKLDKPVKIPCKYIYRVQADDGRSTSGDCSVGDVYGMCGSAWKETLMEISVPKELKDRVAIA